MRFVMAGLIGALVVVAAGYLWFAPANEVASDASAIAGQVANAFGAALNLEPLTGGSAKQVEVEEEAGQAPKKEAQAYVVDPSRVPYPRPRRYRPSSGGGAAPAVVEQVPVVAEVVTKDPAPALKATTIEEGSANETEVYIDPSGARTVVRVREGEVLEATKLPDK